MYIIYTSINDYHFVNCRSFIFHDDDFYNTKRNIYLNYDLIGKCQRIIIHVLKSISVLITTHSMKKLRFYATDATLHGAYI